MSTYNLYLMSPCYHICLYFLIMLSLCSMNLFIMVTVKSCFVKSDVLSQIVSVSLFSSIFCVLFSCFFAWAIILLLEWEHFR